MSPEGQRRREGRKQGRAEGPEDSPVETRSSREVKIRRQPPPKTGGVLEMSMSDRGGVTA